MLLPASFIGFGWFFRVQEDATYIFDEFKLVSGFRYFCGKKNIEIAKTIIKQGDKGKTILTY